jgi:transforming growth factor-beta-induced protein
MKTQKFFNTIKLSMAALLIGFMGISTSFADDAKSSDAQMTIVEIASADARFTILVEAVAKADLVGALSANGPYTVFAPTNEAFEELFETLGVSGVNDLTKDQLTPILLYHVVNGKVMASDVTSGTVSTLNSDASMDVKASKKGVKIDKKSNVIITDVEASNGVIHVIDAVLIPAPADQASASTGGCSN